MRTANVCPTCSTYINALCVIFDGPLLTTLDIAADDDLDTALVKIEAWAANIELAAGAVVSDEAYGPTWSGNTTDGASKNALYDVIESLTSINVSDTAYGPSWDSDTTGAASKNALYDKIESIDSAITDLQNFALEQTIKVSLAPIDIKGLGDTPVPVGISVSPGEQIVVKDILYVATYTPLAHDTNPLVVGYVGGADIDATIDIGFTSNINRYVPISAYDGSPNTALEVRGTNSIATGASSIDLYITYQILTL